MGDFTRLADLLLTNDIDTALRLLDRQVSTVGGGGFLGLGIWRYRTSTTSTPSTGQLQFDNTTIGSATELYVHAVNDSGSDMSAFLNLLTAFDLMYIQVQVDASQFVTIQIGPPSLLSSVYTFPILNIQAQGTTPSNNTEVAVIIEQSGIGSGVTDHGALTGLSDDDHTNYLHKDITRNITVGYTTDIEADSFTNPLTPDFSLEYLKTMTVTGDFTLNVPTGNGHGEYYLTVDSGGPYTLTPDTNVKMMDSNVTLLADENYVLNIHRYSATNVLAQLLNLGGTGGTKWNAYGNTATGGGDYSVDANLSIPEGSSYQIAGVDIINRDSIYELTFGPANTNFPSNTELTPNVIMGYGGSSSSGSRNSLNVGISNDVLWRNSVCAGIGNSVSPAGNGSDVVFGRNNVADNASIVMGTGNTGDSGVVVGNGCTTSSPAGSAPVAGGINCDATSAAGGAALSWGIECSATGANCGAFGISVINTLPQSFKIGPNNATAILISGNGLGVALGDVLADARLHLGAGSVSVPSIIFEESTQLITTPAAGAVEYAPQGGGTDPYIFFTHQTGTRSTLLTTHSTVLDAMSGNASITVTAEDSVIRVLADTGFTGTVDLPDANSANDVVVNCIHDQASNGSILVDAAGTDLVDRATTIAYSAGSSAQLIGNGHPSLSESQTDISFTLPDTISSAALADFSSLSPGDIIAVTGSGGGHAANNDSPVGTTLDGWTVKTATTLTITILEGGITTESAVTAGTVTVDSLGHWDLI